MPETRHGLQRLIAIYAMRVSPEAAPQPQYMVSEMHNRLGSPTPVLLSPEPWPSLVHFDDVDVVRNALTTLRTTGEFHATYRAHTVDGGYIWINDRLSFAAAEPDLASVRNGLGYATAIAEDASAEPEADASEMFCAALTHELGQILSTIGLTAETLPALVADVERNALLSDVLVDRTDRIRKAARRAKRVIHGLYDVIRHDGVFIDPVNLRWVVDTALSHFPKGQIPIQVSLPDKLMVQGNAVLLELAITNLLKNAQEAVLGHTWGELEDASHRIEIDADQTSDHVKLRIRDTGGGIAGNIESAFSRYTTNKTDKRHHGVGLWLVRRIAEHHDGKVTLRNVGRGLEVSLSLPRLQSD